MSDDRILGREALGSFSLRRHTIEMPEWGGSILVRELTHAEKALISEYAIQAIDPATGKIRDGKKLSKASFELIHFSWIHADGTHVLQASDQDALLAEPDSIITKIVREIRALNNMDEGANAVAKKNLEAIMNGVSGTS